ncbi:MAG: ROK family protein [Anaerolineae bacterium]|nr:ROK family protein [Anaerolineae bacterium]
MTAETSRSLTGLLLALDYGGTKHSAALLMRGERSWLALARTYSPPGADARYDQATMLRMAHELLARHPGRLLAVGVSFGGPVDASRGLVRLSHHVPGWEETPLRDQLQAEFGVPVAVDNDANVAALGEWRYGAGQGCASLLYVTVSTGVGGGWVLDGRVWSGADGMAGEIGHTVVRPGGEPCVCGKRGCVEAEACGTAIGRKAGRRLRELLENVDAGAFRTKVRRPSGPDAEASRTEVQRPSGPDTGAVLHQLCAGRPEAVTGEIVSRAAAAGDALALAVLADAAQALGAGLGTAINLMNPERIVLGGGVTKSGDHWWQTVQTTAREHALPQMRVEIVPAGLGDDAPLWGAAALAEGLL